MSESNEIHPFVGIVIPEADVLSGDLERTLRALSVLVSSPTEARQLREAVDVAVSGYDDSPVELFEIPVIREFMSRLDEVFPYWLFFLSKSMPGLKFISLCLLPSNRTPEGKILVDLAPVERLLNDRWLPAMHQLCSWTAMTKDEVAAMTEQVHSYFTATHTPATSARFGSPQVWLLANESAKAAQSPQDALKSSLFEYASEPGAAPNLEMVRPSPSYTSTDSLSNWSQPKGFAPDYGMRLVSEGVLPETDLYFHNFRLYSVDIVSLGHYTTTVELSYEGKRHALSLDFDHSQLETILAKASPEFSPFVLNEISRDPASPRAIKLGEGEIAFGVRARLGEVQRAEKESFVPLVAQEIL